VYECILILYLNFLKRYLSTNNSYSNIVILKMYYCGSHSVDASQKSLTKMFGLPQYLSIGLKKPPETLSIFLAVFLAE